MMVFKFVYMEYYNYDSSSYTILLSTSIDDTPSSTPPDWLWFFFIPDQFWLAWYVTGFQYIQFLEIRGRRRRRRQIGIIRSYADRSRRRAASS